MTELVLLCLAVLMVLMATILVLLMLEGTRKGPRR